MKRAEEQNLSRRQRRELLEQGRSISYEYSLNRNQISSAHKKEKSERVVARKMVARRRRLVAFFSVMFVISCLILIFLSQFVADYKISAVGETVNSLEGSPYRSAIDEYYLGQPLERVRSNLDKDALLAHIQKKHPEVETIFDISGVGFSRFDFKLKFREPVASWSSAGKKTYVDKNGVSFEKNYYSEPSLEIIDEGGSDAGLGKAIASSAFLGFAGRSVDAASSAGLKIEKITIPATSLREVHIYFKGISYPGKMIINESAEGQIKNFISANKYFISNNLKPQYIDLRVEGKGYYR